MTIRFNADEVLEMAAQIERNGGAFYRRAADLNTEGRELLLKIAAQEDEHLALFEQMRAELSSSDTEPTAYDPDNEAALYLQAMADGHVFDLAGSDAATLLKGDETLDDILGIAIQAEKDSIVFFLGLRELIPGESGKDKVNTLMIEETRHIRWLIEQRSS